MQVSVGDQIRVKAGFREGKNAFKNNDIAEVRDVTDTGDFAPRSFSEKRPYRRLVAKQAVLSCSCTCSCSKSAVMEYRAMYIILFSVITSISSARLKNPCSASVDSPERGSCTEIGTASLIATFLAMGPIGTKSW